MRYWICSLLVIFVACFAEEVKADIFEYKGNRHYKKGAYDKALKAFQKKQVKDPKDPKVRFNLGNTYYKLGQYDEAAKAYGALLSEPNPDLQWQSHYNLGNVAFQKGELESAIQHYEEALKINPGDEDTQHNLEFVKKQLQKQKEQQQKQNQEPGEQENNQENQQNQAKDENEGAKKAPESLANQRQDDKGQRPQPMDAQDAKKILNALEENREQFNRKRAQKYGENANTEKPW